ATPQPIRDLNPQVPPWLAAVVERLQAKRPADRLASAADVAELLRYNLEHPDRPRMVTPAGPAPSRPRNRRRLGAACALLFLLGGLALLWTHWFGLSPSKENRVRLRATLSGHQGPVWSVAFAPDGKALVTASDDGTLRFWDASTGKETGVITAPSVV